jgi:cysteine desulfurase
MCAVYLDYNATTPTAPEVAEAMLPFIHSHFGNPSSSHRFGMTARSAVETARCYVAELLECSPEEIIFTSCATEADNLAILGSVIGRSHSSPEIITSMIEHPAVLETCRYCERSGIRVNYLPVDSKGLVSPDDVRKAISPKTVLISIMHANNETGVVQPVEKIGEIAREMSVLFHTDAAQSVGKIPVIANDINADLISIAGHKLYAPKGVGALYVRNGLTLSRIMHGADHERGFRPGTENVIGIVGLGEACRMARSTLPDRMSHLQRMRDKLHEGFKVFEGYLRLNGHTELRLPNTLNLGFKGLNAGSFLSELTDVAASPGAACHSGTPAMISHVLKAMRVPPEFAVGSIRFSTGIMTSDAEIDSALAILIPRLAPLVG